jgi:cyclic-di-AMP phosphodiesterase PgpH
MKPFIKKFLHRFSSSKVAGGTQTHGWVERIKSSSLQKWAIGIGTTLVLASLLAPTLKLPLKEYRIGDIAKKEVKCSQDLLVEDERSTQEKREEAEKGVLSFYDFDPGVLRNAESRIRSAFELLSASVQRGEKGNEQIAKRRKIWEASLSVPLHQREWLLLERERFHPSIGETTLGLLASILNKGVVNDKDLLDQNAGKGILIRDIQSREEKKALPPFSFLDFKEARTKLRSQADLLAPTIGKDMTPLVQKIAESFLRPNLTFNKDETVERKRIARERATPVYFQIKRGEVIVRAGDRVQEEHLLKINGLRKTQESSYFISILFGICLLTFLVLASLYEFATKNIRKIRPSTKDLLFFSSVLLVLIALLKLYLVMTEILGGEFLSIPSSSYLYLFPIAMGAMIIRIVIHSEAAIFFAVLSSYFSAFMVGNQLFSFIFYLVGSVVGAHLVAHCEQRSIVIKAGLSIGGANLLMLLGSNLITGNPLKMIHLFDLVMGFGGGLLASVLVLGLTPIIEGLFGYTTDIKLLELANLENPLLKDLTLQAPGTYHHSVIVGSLVEAAAKSVSANPLLARVSAYYHDVGKLKKPLYFIENIGGSENKHDHLTPSMSSLILISHVKDGVELARENRLGERITRIIQQHHGTGMISFFYQKAKEQEVPEMNLLNEDDFRYPGPKPQTKEAGLVMLADAVEAASRTLTDPTPARIKGLVQQIIQKIFLDGQLEECELTLKNLHNIEESFTRILTAFFHQRIEYPLPSPVEPPKRTHENLDQKSAKTYPFRLKKVKENS